MKQGLCEHCALPLGRWPYQGEAGGETRHFCCYGCFIGWQASNGGGDDAVAAGYLIRLGVGGFLAMNIMLFSLMIYTGSLDTDAELRDLFHLILWLLATPVVIILGAPFLIESAVEMARGRLPPSLLIVIGAGSAYGFSAIATLAGGDRVYFDTATMVLVLFTLGRFLEANGKARATRSLKPFLEPERATVAAVENGTVREIPLSDVQPGMVIQVAPGATIPVDGEVRDGVSETDEAHLTGEARPVLKRPGSPVMAGTMNGEGMLTIRADVAGLDSRWIGICRELRAALARPSRAQRIADQTSQVFVPVVLLIAAVTTAYQWPAGEAGALMAGLAVLVVACPCALGLAAPLATSIAIGDLAGRGILVRSASALETVGRIRGLAFDKTGTLTLGRPSCVEIFGETIDQFQLIAAAASVASGSRHPLSRAVIEVAGDRNVDWRCARDIVVRPGSGVAGMDGMTEVLLGSERWFRDRGIIIPKALETAAGRQASRGHLLTFVGWNGSARGLFAFDDPVQRQARDVLSWLARERIATAVVSGDGLAQTERLCRSLGIETWRSDLSPEEKQEALARIFARARPVAMVGDGLNDAPAMAASAVGIAVGRSADLTRETAEVVLPQARLGLLPDLIGTARRARRTIATNLGWAFGYNAIALGLAASGALRPVMAAALMAGSSLVVVANSVARRQSAPTAQLKKKGPAVSDSQSMAVVGPS